MAEGGCGQRAGRAPPQPKLSILTACPPHTHTHTRTQILATTKSPPPTKPSLRPSTSRVRPVWGGGAGARARRKPRCVLDPPRPAPPHPPPPLLPAANSHKGLYPGWDTDLHYVVSLDFFHTAVAKMVPCGNLFEVRASQAPADRALAPSLPGLASPQRASLPPPTLRRPLRWWRTRCTWRCRPTARWAPTASRARPPAAACRGGQVRSGPGMGRQRGGGRGAGRRLAGAIAAARVAASADQRNGPLRAVCSHHVRLG